MFRNAWTRVGVIFLVALLAIAVISTVVGDDLFPPERIPPEKKAILDREAEERRVYQLTPFPTYAGQPDFPVQPSPTFAPPRLLQKPQPGPLVGRRAESSWLGYVDDRMIVVISGALDGDRQQGLITIFADFWTTDSGSRWEGSTQSIYGPYGTGWLRIDSVSGSELSISSASGQSFVFDAATRELKLPDGTLAVATVFPVKSMYAPTPTPTSIPETPTPEFATTTVEPAETTMSVPDTATPTAVDTPVAIDTAAAP